MADSDPIDRRCGVQTSARSGLIVAAALFLVHAAGAQTITMVSLRPGNCLLHLDPRSSAPAVLANANAAGAWRFRLTMSSDRRFVGAVFHLQAVFAAGNPPVLALTRPMRPG